MWNIELPKTEYFGLEDVGSARFANFMNEFAAQKLVAIDTETTGLVRWKDIPLYWSLAWGNKRFTLHAALLPYTKSIFAEEDRDWAFAGAKYDAHILANVGIQIAGRFRCTQVMHSLLYDDEPHGLKYMAKTLLGWTWGDFQHQFGKINKANPAETVIRRAEQENLALLVEYAANDAWGTLGVHNILKKQLEAAVTHSLFRDKPPYIETLYDYFHKIEGPYTKVLWRMERRGVKVDRQRLADAKPQAEAEIARIEKEITGLVGRVLNLNSPKQLGAYFFEQEKLVPVKYTKGGKSGVRAPSVDDSFLKYYKHEHPVAKLMLEHREYSKLLGTYIEGLHDLLDPLDRIHTSFNQSPRTGRLSSSDPNLCN